MPSPFDLLKEAKEWLASMERHQYRLEDGIGCSVDMKVDEHTVKCAVATFALSEFKQHVIRPGTELNNKILAWAGDMRGRAQTLLTSVLHGRATERE